MQDRRAGCRWSRRRFLAAAGIAGLAGCGTTMGGEQTLFDRYDLSVAHDSTASDWTAPTTAPPTELETTTLVENLEIPWDLSFAADGTLFITERVGRVLAFDGQEARPVVEPTDAIDAGAVEPGERHDSWWVEGGEGGTLGVAAHPNYPDPPIVYLYYSAETNDGKRNRLVAVDVDADDPSATVTTLVEGIPADAVHNGGRITFGPANYLWVTCGDAGEAGKAQDPATLHGTVLRLTLTGEPAPDNPDLGSDADPRIYTYGHRNPQGIVFLPDGTPIVTEHGPGGRDEINRLVAGANYGWPDVRQRADYVGAEDVHRPLANSGEPPAWAPTGAVFYTGEAVPGLTNRLLVGGLYSQRLTIATLTPPGGDLPPVGDGMCHEGEWTDDAYTATTHPALQNELGRIRHVEQGPDGGLYLVTSNRDGRAKAPFPTEGDDVLVRLA